MSQTHSSTVFKFMFFIFKITKWCFLKWLFWPWNDIIFTNQNDLILLFKILFSKWEIKFKILGVFLQRCSNVVTTLRITLFLNVGTTLCEHWYFGQPTTFTQCSDNIFTMLGQCWKLHNFQYCSLVGFQCWAPTFIQCSHNVAWTLCEDRDITSFSIL